MGGCASKSSDVRVFMEECLERHNELRARHGAPPLKLDQGLCRLAQKWSNHLVRLGEMRHREDGRFKGGAVGENIHWKSYSSTDPRLVKEKKVTGEEVADSWYNEINDPGYSFANPGFQSGAGHFTQLVWKESSLVGFGVSKKLTESEVQYYVVANYYPAGNINTPEYFTDNVLRPNRR